MRLAYRVPATATKEMAHKTPATAIMRLTLRIFAACPAEVLSIVPGQVAALPIPATHRPCAVYSMTQLPPAQIQYNVAQRYLAWSNSRCAKLSSAPDKWKPKSHRPQSMPAYPFQHLHVLVAGMHVPFPAHSAFLSPATSTAKAPGVGHRCIRPRQSLSQPDSCKS